LNRFDDISHYRRRYSWHPVIRLLAITLPFERQIPPPPKCNHLEVSACSHHAAAQIK